MKTFEVIIFDCDGVLFDTREVNTRYYNTILHRFGLPSLTTEQIGFVQMHTVDESLALLFPDAALLAEARQFRRQINAVSFIEDMRMEPTLLDLMHKLRPAYKTAIATNRTDTMNRVLATHGLEPYFDKVVTALQVERPKPHPDSILAVLAHFNVAAGQALYIGDSKLDETASLAAQVPFVAYADPQLSAAAYHIRQLIEVWDILENPRITGSQNHFAHRNPDTPR
jgi:phosphoglycolate phosphatase